MRKLGSPQHADECTHFSYKLEAVSKQLQDARFLTDRANRESLYHLLKQIRDWSTVSNRKDVYGFSLLLLRQFLRDDPDFRIIAPTIASFHSLLKGLILALHGVGTTEQRMAATVDTKTWTRPKAIVLGEGWFHVDATFGLLPRYSATVIPFEEMEQVVSREIINEKEFVLIVNLAPGTLGEQAVATLRESAWGQSIPVIGIVPGKDAHWWNARAATDVDVILTDLVQAAHLDAAILRVLARRRKRSTLRKEIERKEMGKVLQKEWLRYNRFQTHFCLMYVILEQYSHLVQTYGAKEVLTFYEDLYALGKQTIRNYDEIWRWKANAIVMMLPMTKGEGAKMAAERLLSKLEKNKKAEAFQSFVKVVILESEHGYKSGNDMVVRLEEELAAVPAHVKIYQVPPMMDEPERRTKRIKLLIVDDDLVAPTIISNHLGPDEWEVDICTDGAEALERAVSFRPDVILSETSVTGMNGFAFCLHVRQMLSSKTVFFFLSKQGTSHNILRGLQVGADDFVSKPFSAAVLEAKIRRHLQIRMS